MNNVHPDRDDQAPDDRVRAARWLVSRHPQLQRLLARVPGFLDDDGDPDVDLLANTVCDYEQHLVAWTVYVNRHPVPQDDERFETWREAGPKSTEFVDAVSDMSPSERSRLRMLATFSTERVPVSVADFASLDASGRALLTDWTVAVRCAA